MGSSEPKCGGTVGSRYRIEKVLGSGEQGSSYLCRDQAAGGEKVTLKTLAAWRAKTDIENLRVELSLLRRVHHPHLADVLDFGVLDGGKVPYLVRQYVEGEDILSGSADWSVEEILSVLVQMCRSLQYLHVRGIVHRHLKPSNVMLCVRAEGERSVRILDFGLERRAGGVRRTAPTLMYASPEELLGHVRQPASDLYSLGILAYQMLTRRLPFDDEDEGYLIQKHLQGKVDMRPVERLPGGAGLAQVMLALLEKEPGKRPSSADDVIRLLSVASGRDFHGTAMGVPEAYFSAARLVGREEEMTFLQDRAAGVRTGGRGCSVFVTGESGSGKSRCMEELKTWALLDGWRVAEASCLPRESQSYGPYRRILARAGEMGHDPLEGEADEAEYRYGDGVSGDISLPFDLSSESAAGPFRDKLTRQLVRLVSDRPTLLLLHDFHWADEAIITVLDYLTSDIQAHPVFLCVSLRPGEEKGPLSRLLELSVRQKRAETLALKPLTHKAIADLIAGVTGETTLASEIGPWMHAASGGNPFFVEEMLKHFVDRNLLRREMGKWRMAPPGSGNLEVPSSVSEVLRRRLAQLSPEAARITGWLAVLRRGIQKEQLQELSGLEGAGFDAALCELQTRQILAEVPPGGGGICEFRHAVISEVITEDLPSAKRRQMHRKIGEMLESYRDGNENVQELAFHFMEGKRDAKAVQHAIKAARACKAEFSNDSALRFYEYLLRNKRLLSEDQVCDIAIEAADTYCALGHPKRSIHVLQGKNIVTRSKGSWELEAKRLKQLGLSAQYLGDLSRTSEFAKQGLSLAKRHDERYAQILKATFLKQLAYCEMMKSSSKKALALLMEALQITIDIKDHKLSAEIYALISANQRVSCELHSAMKSAEQSIKIAEKTMELPILSTAYSHLGVNKAALGRFAVAESFHRKAVCTSERARSPILRSQALGNLAECLCRRGNLVPAGEFAEMACAIVEENDNPIVHFSALATLAEINLFMGRVTRASDILIKLNLVDTRCLPVHSRAHISYLCALLAYETANFESATHYLRELDSIETIEAPIYEKELGEVLRAKILWIGGNHCEAIALLEKLRSFVVSKRWPYQACAINMTICELLIFQNQFEIAQKCLRNASRIAKAMSCEALIIKGNLLQGRLTIKFNNLKVSSVHLMDLLDIRSKLLENLELANNCALVKLRFQLFSLISCISEVIKDYSASHYNAKMAIDTYESMSMLVPKTSRESFLHHPLRIHEFEDCKRRAELPAMSVTNQVIPGAELDNDQVRMVLRLSRVMGTDRDLKSILGTIGQLISRALGFQRILVLLNSDPGHCLEIAFRQNLFADTVDSLESTSRFIIREVAKDKRPFLSANISTDSRLAKETCVSDFPNSVFCSPLISGTSLLGILYADSCVISSDYDETKIDLFALFSRLAAIAVENARARHVLFQERCKLEKFMQHADSLFPEILGNSNAINKLRQRIALAAASPLDVLIWGESGTGKELIARALHRTGKRASRPFVAFDCGSLTDSLVESELFGYRRGAFTGAIESRAGLFEAAIGGVVFLDEVSNLSMRLQKKFLRLLQEREVRRIGENYVRKIDIQIFAATNKDLRIEVQRGRFRNDLFFRLNGMEIFVPPLRQRKEDIGVLIAWFLNQLCRNNAGSEKSISTAAYNLLLNYKYPGNVRELKSIVERSFYSTIGNTIEVENIPDDVARNYSIELEFEANKIGFEIYRRITNRKSDFETSVKQAFINRKIGPEIVKSVFHYALSDAKGKYNKAFELLGIPPQGYAAMMQFIKRNLCYLDFRKYRNSRLDGDEL